MHTSARYVLWSVVTWYLSPNSISLCINFTDFICYEFFILPFSFYQCNTTLQLVRAVYMLSAISSSLEIDRLFCQSRLDCYKVLINMTTTYSAAQLPMLWNLKICECYWWLKLSEVVVFFVLLWTYVAEFILALGEFYPKVIWNHIFPDIELFLVALQEKRIQRDHRLMEVCLEFRF